MRLIVITVSVGLLAAPAFAQSGRSAQGPSQPPTAGAVLVRLAQGAWAGAKRNMVESADQMPEANYSFKPTPEVRSFGELVGHVAESQHGVCLGLKGERPAFERGSIEKKTAKADLVKALQDAIAVCDSVYGAATDESLVKLTKVGQNELPPINHLWYNISHTNEHYGNMVTYFRMNGIVPPSSRR